MLVIGNVYNVEDINEVQQFLVNVTSSVL